jgi:chitin disaccharide deacetylase
VHMFPAVLRPVLRAAKSCGILRVRNPFEPAWSTRATVGAPLIRRIEVALLHLLERKFLRIVSEEGFLTTAGSLGVLATGTLDRATVAALLRAAEVHGEGKPYEVVAHPGYNDADLARVRTRLRDSREQERQALAALREFPSLSRISFAQLA